MNVTTLRCFIIGLLFWGGAGLTAVSSQTENICDSLINMAIKASLKKDYQYSLELLSEAKILAQKEKSFENLFWILTNIGINQAEMLNYNNALEQFFSAYKIAVDKLSKRQEVSILNNIAGIYMLDGKYDKANEYYMKVYDTVKRTSDSLFIGGCAMNIVSTGLYMNNMTQVNYYMEIAENMLEKYPLELLRLSSLQVNYYLQKGNNRKAHDLAVGIYQEILKQKESGTLRTDILMGLVRSCIAIKDYVTAINYSLEALKENLNMEERKAFYTFLSEAYYKNGRYEEAFSYKDSMIFAIDSLWNIVGNKQFENNRIQFELFKKEKELEEYQLKHQTDLIVLLLSVGVVLVLLWALINQSVKNKQQKRIVDLELDKEKKNQQLLKNKLDEQQTKALLEQKQFQYEIEMKGRELMSNALIMVNRNDQIQEIINMLTALSSMKRTSRAKLKDCIRQLQKQLNETAEWKNFTTYFEQVNDAFILSLKNKHPELTANEIRFLSLVYINLTTKEISLLLNITQEYCKKKKQQITHKLGLDDTKSLYPYLSSL